MAAPLPATGIEFPERPDGLPRVPGAPNGVPTAAGGCGGNEMPFRYALEAALEGLHHWLQGGPALPRPPRALFVDGVLQRDEYGNALGGLRLPPVDVPVATYSADGCPLFGSTTPLRPDQLLALYPDHGDYVAKIERDRHGRRRSDHDARGWCAAAPQGTAVAHPALEAVDAVRHRGAGHGESVNNSTMRGLLTLPDGSHGASSYGTTTIRRGIL